MIRLAKVVAKSNRFVLLSLLQAEKCVGCPVNCNKPLINFFALRKNLFALSFEHANYQLVDRDDLLSQTDLLGQNVHIEIDNHDLVKSSVWLYLIPLLSSLTFISIGHLIGHHWQISTDLMALLGLIFGLLVFYLFAHRKKNIEHLKFRPKVTILSSNGT